MVLETLRKNVVGKHGAFTNDCIHVSISPIEVVIVREK